MDGLHRLLSQTGGLHFMWLGNDGWLLWDGKRLLATDPDLLNPERLSPPPVDPAALAAHLDAVFLTHEHEDHFNLESCRLLSQKGNCAFVIPESCAKKAKALPKDRVLLTRPGKQLEAAGIQADTVRALHGHLLGAVYSGANLLDCGYRFRLAEKSVYQPGDTLLLEEHFTMPSVDVLMVSPTEHNTWVENSVRLIEQLSPALILVQHFGTYREAPDNLFWTHGYVEELRTALGPTLRDRLRIPILGGLISL